MDPITILTNDGTIHIVSTKCNFCPHHMKNKKIKLNGRRVDAGLYCQKFDRKLWRRRRCSECIDAEAMFKQYGKLAE